MPRMVKAACGHLIPKERRDNGRDWCTRLECQDRFTDIVALHTDWETGETRHEEAQPQNRAWLREGGR